MRYTAKRYEEDLEVLNEKMEKLGSDMRFVSGYRNDYTALDLAYAEQMDIHSNLETGTPIECYNAAARYVAATV